MRKLPFPLRNIWNPKNILLSKYRSDEKLGAQMYLGRRLISHAIKSVLMSFRLNCQNNYFLCVCDSIFTFVHISRKTLHLAFFQVRRFNWIVYNPCPIVNLSDVLADVMVKKDHCYVYAGFLLHSTLDAFSFWSFAVTLQDSLRFTYCVASLKGSTKLWKWQNSDRFLAKQL